MNLNENLEKLKLFNEKADKLNRSDLIKQLSSIGTGVRYTFNFKNNDPVKIEVKLPSEGAIDAFMNNYRFFCQNNEGSSFINMQSVYDSLPISPEKKELFNCARRELNEFLDSPPEINFIFNNRQVQRREILDTLMYGLIVHSNKEKREKVKSWRNDPLLFPMILQVFSRILGGLLVKIIKVQRLNKEVIRELEAS